MKRILALGAGLALTLWLGGCSTLSGDFHQTLQIDARDNLNRPVDGMQCEFGSGTSKKTFVTPATNVRVRRGFEPLNIECRLDSLVATATVKSRRERMEEALLPLGSVGVFVDHVSGSLYAYPTTLHLRVGQHLVLEHGGEARVVEAEPVPGAPQPRLASAPHAELAAVQPTTVKATTGANPAAPAPRKPAVPAAKADRAVVRTVKTVSSAGGVATSKVRGVPPKNESRTTTAKVEPSTTASKNADAVAGSAAAAAHSAPVNW